MKHLLISILLIAASLNGAFGQTRLVQWEDLPTGGEDTFPLAYVNGASGTEKAINAYLQDRYLNHEGSHRDTFYEYQGLYPTAIICGVAIDAAVALTFYQEKGKMRAVGKWYDLVKKKNLTIELFEY